MLVARLGFAIDELVLARSLVYAPLDLARADLCRHVVVEESISGGQSSIGRNFVVR